MKRIKKEKKIKQKTKNEWGDKNQKEKVEKYGSNRRVQKDGSKVTGPK